MKSMIKRYANIVEKAQEFANVVEIAEGHLILPPPGGMSGSKMSWRKQVGDTIYLGKIMRLAAELE